MAFFKLDTPLTFGKYKGHTVDTIDWFELHHKAMEELLDVTMKWDGVDFDHQQRYGFDF